MRSVTKQAVKEARLREIKEELLNSKKLKVPPAPRGGCGVGMGWVRGARSPPVTSPPRPQTYFEDNPRDLHVLRHDKPLHPAIVKPHLRNVPDYLGTSRARRRLWGGGAGWGHKTPKQGEGCKGRGCPRKALHPLLPRSVPAVPPSLRSIAKPNLKKHKRLRLSHAGAGRRGGPTVSAGQP